MLGFSGENREENPLWRVPSKKAAPHDRHSGRLWSLGCKGLLFQETLQHTVLKGIFMASLGYAQKLCLRVAMALCIRGLGTAAL